MVFDGKKFAAELEKELVESGKLAGKSLLVLQCDGTNKESAYVRLKRETGERLGVKVKTQELENSKQLKEKIKSKEIDGCDGVLVQLPILGATKEETEGILNLIPIEKDVDGLNSASLFQPAVVRAVEKVMDSIKVTPLNSLAVVGARGMVGKRLVTRLTKLGFTKIGIFDIGDDLNKLEDYWVVISATGSAGLIKASLLREGVVAIDLGYPQGDFRFDEVKKKASFITPVPGGVGPMTVECLYENLAETKGSTPR